MLAVEHIVSRRRGSQSGLTLVELLVGIIVAAIVTTMLVTIFIGLQRAYSYTINSDDARAAARDAIARMSREIRDMQQQPAGQPLFGQPTILLAESNEIRFTTAWGDPGSGGGNIYLTRYVYSPLTGDLCRQRDSDNNGYFDSNDQKSTIAKNIVNAKTPSTGSPTPVFQYRYYDDSGNLVSSPTVPGSMNRSRVASIQIRLIADVNPAHPPIYLDLITTVQPRNLRQI